MHTWKIPSFRRDLQRDVDLIEEVVRAYGIDKIPGTTRGRFMPMSPADRSHDLETLFFRESDWLDAVCQKCGRRN